MISSFRLKFGRTPGTPEEEIQATPVTVFVGPNNSGKSRVLSEIDRYCRSGTVDASALVLGNITFRGLDTDNAHRTIEKIRQPSHAGEAIQPNHIFVGSRHNRQQVPRSDLLRFIQRPTENTQAFCQWFLQHSTLMLDGRNRMNLTGEQPGGDLQLPPQSSFQVLFHDNAKRHEVRRIVHDAFSTHFVIDPTNLGQLRIRLSSRPPDDDSEECGIDQRARRFHGAAQLIDEASDGVKAFSGIVTEVIAGAPRVILVDEPEAFLHPSLAFKLGCEVAIAARGSDKRVFAPTHSPAFVMGCIQSGAPVTIVRLTYRAGVATARVLPDNEILELMRHPLLRSTNVLSGLFYKCVVVTESDADRAFYQEVNERLLQFRPEWGIRNCLFLNAQNKQTVHTIIRPLRKLGIPAAAVVDVDVLKEGGTTWSNLVTAANIPNITCSALATTRSALKTAMEATGRDMKRDGGLSILSAQDQESGRGLLTQLAEYGIFVVPGGELESWLRHLGASGHGPAWLIDIFERMGEDSNTAGYVRPTSGGVWEFTSNIQSWLVSPNRSGIPG